MPLDIMIQNCRWTSMWNKRARFNQIKQKIIEKKPDIVCLQELVFSFDRRFFQLEGYYQISAPANLKNRGGLLTLVKSSVGECHYRNYAKQGRILSIQVFERFLGKGFLATYLSDKDLWVVNTHMQAVHKIIEKHDIVQEKQLDELLEFIKSKNRVILCGDLNFTPFSQNYKKVTQFLTDLSSVDRSTYIKKAQTLDYIMVRGLGCTINKRDFFYYNESGVRVSDHIGVFVSFDISEESSANTFEIVEKIDTIGQFANKY